MANTTEPKDFWRVTRIALMPSLWRETLGRVAMEGLANGVPVLASDRGALPGTLGDAGFVFTIPAHYVPENAGLPTAREVAPWVGVIEKLWDDAPFEAEHWERARREAERWATPALIQSYAELFSGISPQMG
jgi:glycosyltransferase involved in cell wall biosynthesis